MPMAVPSSTGSSTASTPPGRASTGRPTAFRRERAHDDGAGALGRRGRGGHRLLPALLRVVRLGLRGALRVAGARVARGVSEVRDRRRADRRVGLAVYEPGALRGRADDPLAGGVGARQDVPRGARDLGRLAAVRGGVRGPRPGRPPPVAADEADQGLIDCRLLRAFGPEGVALADDLLRRRMGEHPLDAFNVPFESWIDTIALSNLWPGTTCAPWRTRASPRGRGR